MTNTITLSGWGQNYDSLNVIAPDANHIDYKAFESTDALFASLQGKPCDTLIGWSLGGQLAIRAIESGVLAPKLLVLIAAPFQFIRGRGLKCGIDVDSFNVFENDFQRDPIKSLKDFSLLIANNDTNAKEIVQQLRQNNNENLSLWLPWLEELRHFSCQKIDLTGLPKTIAIHGRDDSVIDVAQADLFRPFIKDYRVEILPHCGHAPHLHDPELLRKILEGALAIG